MRDITPFRRSGLVPSDFFKGFFGRDLIDEFFDNNLPESGLSGGFCADIKENDKEFVVEAELPGYDKKDIEIDLLDNRLTISAKKDKLVEEEKENYIRRERRSGQVARAFVVSGIKNDKVKAEYTDGLLKVILPKQEKKKPRNTRIAID